jgi:hypothetical protein
MVGVLQILILEMGRIRHPRSLPEAMATLEEFPPTFISIKIKSPFRILVSQQLISCA